MIKEILAETESKMKSSVHVLEEDLHGLRTGRASTALVEKLMVDYYDTPTPLSHLATLSVPESQTIAIRPFDKGTLGLIERAIMNSDININPNNDGTIIRLNLPALTQERRKELVKQMHKKLEDAKVAIRNIRRASIDDVRDFEKEKMVTEDESEQAQESIQKLTDKYIAQIDEVGKNKEKEIMDF